MSRNNPIGQGGQPPMWRHPSEQEPFPAPPAAPAQNYGYQQQGQGYYFPPPEQAPAQPPFGHFPPAQQVPYPPPPQDWGPQQQQQPDPRGYDLGGYMPADAQAYAPAPTTQYPQHSQHTQHGYGDPDPDFDDMVEDDDEPRRGRRVLMVVAALVGAIGLGGGLAYTYKNFVLTKGNSRPAVIKTADLGPSKVKPIAPGGKEFAHTDRKLLNRLGDDNSQPASAEGQDRGGDERDAPRKVRVIDIKPGEQGSAASASPPAPVVPGLLLDNSGPQPPPGAVRAAPPPPQASAQPPVRAVPPPPVKVVTAPAPAPTADEAPAAAPKQTNQAALPKAAPLKVAVPKSPPPAASPPPQTTGTSGYVAVLSSQKSRMDALKAFADLQQKYGDVLLSRTPDVQEADLSARGLGTMYRLVVGPPGSRDAASGVCSQLKTAGYQGCWVMAY